MSDWWIPTEEQRAIDVLSSYESPNSLLRVALKYVRARIWQLHWRALHDGGDNKQLVTSTKRAYNKLKRCMEEGL